ncbi:hypothetical protein LOD99_11515 [Oopsacas minuta]|uniref:PH domain-containing protein n=1 Tax=Oopsacas minuta TaxID=111878 RepID=A0AAV7JK28_9METZ|nr:hypothetical protein LOD99_11515 [Oopsacas minuta]
MDLSESRGLRKHTEIKKIKNLPKSADEKYVFGIAIKKRVFIVCAEDAMNYSDWTWSLHSAITQSNPEVVQQSIGNFVGNRTDPFQWIGDDTDCYESDSSSSEDDAIQATRENSKLDLQTIQKMKKSASKQSLKSDSWKEDRIKLVQTPDGLKMKQNSKTETKNSSKYLPAKFPLKDRFNSTTNWSQNHSAPSTPTLSHKPKYSYDQSESSKSKLARASTPLGAMSSKMRSSLSKIKISGSMNDLRDVIRPQSSLERAAPSKLLKRSSSGTTADEEQRAARALEECLDEVEVFKQQIETFLGKEVLLEQDLTRMIHDKSLHPNGYRKFKGMRDTVRSILQNLYKGLVAVAEPPFIRKEAATVLAKFQFTIYKIPSSPQRPASSLMLQTLGGRRLEWDYFDPPADCCLHYYLQLQLGDDGIRLVDIMTTFQCEMFWENLLRGKESKFSIQIERGVAKWQKDLEKRLGRRIGMFVDITELLREVPDQSIRYKAVEGVGNNFCKDSLGKLVDILDNLVENQLIKKQLRKRLRYIELAPLPKDSEKDKVVEWHDGGLVVRAKWHNGVTIQYIDIFQCFESET